MINADDGQQASIVEKFKGKGSLEPISGEEETM